MDITNLELFKKLEDINDWVSREWEDKEPEGKIVCIEYIEPFIEVENFITASPDNSKELTDYICENFSLEQVRNIKRMYEETKRFVGFKSIDFNFFIDDVVDELNMQEIMEEERSGTIESKKYKIQGNINNSL